MKILLFIILFLPLSLFGQCTKTWFWYSEKHQFYLSTHKIYFSYREIYANKKMFTLQTYSLKSDFLEKYKVKWNDTKLILCGCEEKIKITYK